MSHLSLASPVGVLTLWEEGGAVSRVDWGQRPDSACVAPVLVEAGAQLAEYFRGEARVFDLPLAPCGDGFGRAFRSALCAIGYGETRTYGDLARDLGVTPQAIGQACARNPVPILVPCHRVLSAAGLGGYSGGGGVEAKVALLKLEGAASLLI